MAIKLVVAPIVFIFSLFLAVPARADSDGYYCVGPKYLAYQFGFAPPSADPHRLNVVPLGGAAVIAEPIVFDLPQFQVHGMACDEGRIRVAAFDRLYRVALDAELRPIGLSVTAYSKPGAFPADLSARQQNLAAWSRPVNTLEVERVSLLKQPDGYEIILEITPRAAAERCVTEIATRLIARAVSGQVDRELPIFDGKGRRECAAKQAAAAGDRRGALRWLALIVSAARG